MELRPPCGDADYELAAASNNRLLPRRAHTAGELQLFYTQVAHEHLLAWEGETLAGSGAVFVEAGRAWPTLRFFVEPTYRGRGIGSAFFDRFASWSREHGYERLEAWIDDDQPEAVAFVQRRGFTLEGHDDTLELDLRDYEPPVVAPPPGVEIVRWVERPELVHGLYAVACEAYVDIPGEESYDMQPLERWLEHDMQGPGDSPEWTFVAVAGDEVVGYSKFSLTEATPTIADHDLTGVRRSWRGRGIARALKSAQVRWAKEHGYELLLTSNEDRNVPIRRLNEEFGYRLGVGRGTWRGQVPG